MAVRAGEGLLLSSVLPFAAPFLHVVELGYVAHYLYAMGLLRRHGECPIGDVSPCSDRGGCQAWRGVQTHGGQLCRAVVRCGGDGVGVKRPASVDLWYW